MSLGGQYIPKETIAESIQSMWFMTHVKRWLNKKKRLYLQAKSMASEDGRKRYCEHAQTCRTETKTL